MGRRRKWRWKEIVPYSTCTCFGRKEWEAIVEEEDTEAGPARREAISFDNSGKNARYIRSAAEVKVLTKPELARGYLHHERDRRHSSLQEHDLKILEKLENTQYQTKCGLRFLSLHRVRRRPRPALKCTKENSAVLDVQYMNQAGRLLSTVGDWDFNIFTLNKLTNGRAMFHTTLHLFQEHQLIDIFKLDIIKLMRFISLVEDGYHSSNPYHNAVHAADVAQAIHCYLKEPKLAKSLSPLEKLGAIVSAITHDLDHPGVNQAFLIATSNHLASLYNNTSVLENHHWRSAVGLMHESGVFDHFDESLWKTIEWQLKSLILATDITRQSEFLARFRNHLDQKNLNLEDIEHKNFIMQIALKCADICNPCRPWEVSKRWSELVCDEFFKQGDCERQLSLPVTPLCDRMSTTVPKIQTGFMKFVVTPLFQEWYRFVPSALSEMMLSNISTNHSNWERIDQEAEPSKKQKDQDTLLEEEEEEEDVEDDSSSSDNHSNHITQTTVVIIEQEPRHVEEDKENTDPSDSLPEVQLPEDSEDEDEEEELGGEDCLVPLCLYRRHSLPPPLLTGRDGLSLPSRRDSFPRSMSRRYSLPVSAMPNSNSFDKLVEKLSSLVECSPTNGTHFDYDQRPKMASGSQNLDAKTLSNATLEASKQTSAHGLDPVHPAHRQYTSEPHIAMLAHQYRLNNRHNNLAHLARNLSVAGLLPRFQQTTASSRNTSSSPPRSSSSVSASHPSLPALSSGSAANRLGNNNNIMDGVAATRAGAVTSASTQPTSHLDLSAAIRGPRRSLGDTSSLTRCVTGDPQGDRNSHLVTTHSVDAICLSGVNTADRRSSEPSKHSSMTIATNHKTVTMESLDSNNTASMATSKHQSSSEEETPLLQDLMKFNKDGSTGAMDTHNSHANDSFSH